jgi:DNA-directed RNA polymerase specialized sigma24 family protein
MASLDDFDEIVEPHMDRLYSFAYYLAGEEA